MTSLEKRYLILKWSSLYTCQDKAQPQHAGSLYHIMGQPSRMPLVIYLGILFFTHLFPFFSSSHAMHVLYQLGLQKENLRHDHELHTAHDNRLASLDNEQNNFLNSEKSSCNAHNAQKSFTVLVFWEAARILWGDDREQRHVSSAIKADNTSANRCSSGSIQQLLTNRLKIRP